MTGSQLSYATTAIRRLQEEAGPVRRPERVAAMRPLEPRVRASHLPAMVEASSPVHRLRVDIVPDDIDHMGHVNNAVYLKWVQEAVLAYWGNTASAEEAARHLWVALRHDITYRRPAFLSDTIDAVVIADGVRGSRAFFRTLIKRGEEVLVDVRSSWCCLDATTRKPVRVARDVLRRSVTA